jgi:hypothetical protein
MQNVSVRFENTRKQVAAVNTPLAQEAHQPGYPMERAIYAPPIVMQKAENLEVFSVYHPLDMKGLHPLGGTEGKRSYLLMLRCKE